MVVPNDKLLEVADSNTSFVEAFNMADEVLKKGVQGITDLIAQDGMINLDFADVETVMRDRGVAHMGIGSGKGEDKVKDAVKNAIESPLLETTVAGAKAILLNITGGFDMGMMDINEASQQIQSVADKDAIIIFGAAINSKMQDEMSITVLATGFENQPANYVQGSKGTGLGLEEDTPETENKDNNGFVSPEPIVEGGFSFNADEKNDVNHLDNKKKTLKDAMQALDNDKEVPSKFDIPSFLK